MEITPTYYVILFIAVCISLGLVKPVVNDLNTVFSERSFARTVFLLAAFLIVFILFALFVSGFIYLTWYMPFVASFFGALVAAMLDKFNPLDYVIGGSGEVVYALFSVALFIAMFTLCGYAYLSPKC